MEQQVPPEDSGNLYAFMDYLVSNDFTDYRDSGEIDSIIKEFRAATDCEATPPSSLDRSVSQPGSKIMITVENNYTHGGVIHDYEPNCDKIGCKEYNPQPSQPGEGKESFSEMLEKKNFYEQITAAYNDVCKERDDLKEELTALKSKPADDQSEEILKLKVEVARLKTYEIIYFSNHPKQD